MAEKNDFKWYVLKAISGKETKVKEYIETAMRTAGWDEFVSQVLVPTKKIMVTRGGKRVQKEQRYLPGYVLVEANLVDECYPRLRNVPNVLGFLGDTKGSVVATPVRQAEINRILGHIDETEETNFVDIPFLVGESVKVTDGPFSGFTGEIDEIMTDKHKLKVIVTVFGRKTPLELGFNQVDKE